MKKMRRGGGVLGLVTFQNYIFIFTLLIFKRSNNYCQDLFKTLLNQKETT